MERTNAHTQASLTRGRIHLVVLKQAECLLYRRHRTNDLAAHGADGLAARPIRGANGEVFCVSVPALQLGLFDGHSAYVWEGNAMIVTPRLSVDIVRYVDARAGGLSWQRVALSEVADALRGFDDLIFDQAVDLARCRGWIIVEGKSTVRRTCLTEAGRRLVAKLGQEQTTPRDLDPQNKREALVA